MRKLVNPEENQTLWRRIFAVIGVVTLLAGLFLIWASGLDRSGREDSKEVVLPEGTFDPNAARIAEANKAPACEPGALKVTAITDKTSYASGENPQISLAIENVSAAPCYHNLGTSQMVFEIQTGGQTVWLSTHCQESPDDRYVTLAAGQRLVTDTLLWNRTYSTAGLCDGEREQVPAEGASYHLLVAVGEIPAQESRQFLLY